MAQAQRNDQQSEIRRRVIVCRERLRRSRATQKMVERAALTDSAWETAELRDGLAETNAGQDASAEEDEGLPLPGGSEAVEYCALPTEAAVTVLRRIGGAREEARR